MLYQDFDLSIEPSDLGAARYRVRVLASPAGQASDEFVLPFSALELENFFLRMGRPRRGVRGRGDSPEMAAAKEFGSKLYRALFQEQVQNVLARSLDRALADGQGLRLRLRLTHASGLIDLPWEFLYDPVHERFFAQSNQTPLVRFVDLPQSVPPLLVQTPLKVLVLIASPTDYDPLDVEKEWRDVQTALGDLQRRGLVQVTRLPQGTLAALRRHLQRDDYHIIHFIGHGTFDPQTEVGVLVLENEQRQPRLVGGQQLCTLLHDHRSLRLVVLNSCEGARTMPSDPFAGIAQMLVQQGLPAVIAMQFAITDAAALTLAQEFYTTLATGYPVDAALAEARKAIYNDVNDIEWGTPVLYLRAQDGNIFDISAASATDTQGQVRFVPIPLSTAQPAAAKALRWRQPGLWLVACVLLLLVIGWTQQPRFARWLAALQGDSVPPVVTKTAMSESGNTAGVVITATATLTATGAPTNVVLILTATATKLPIATATLPPAPTATPIPLPTATLTLAPGAPLTVTVSGISFIFLYVPAGEFTIGSPEGTGYDDERPSTQVALPAFWIGQTEVTNAQYRPFVEGGGYQQDQWWTQTGLEWRNTNNVEKPDCWADTPGDQENYPVICVSWYEAFAYAQWLADATQLPIRLPTEAEWERAARGDDGRIYPWGNPWDGSRLNFCDTNCTYDWKDNGANDGYAQTAPVGNYPQGASPYGALDMAGNVWEWTNSRYLDYPYQNADAHENAEGDAGRVLRGGSWYFIDLAVRVASRSRYSPYRRNLFVGGRLVVGAPQ